MFVKHDQEFMKSKEGKSLYARWRNIRYQRCEEWDDFSKFAEWALNNGFSMDAQLKRHDNRVEYKPGNCYFHEPVSEYAIDDDCIKRWNDTVNKIRVHFGMKPLEVDNE